VLVCLLSAFRVLHGCMWGHDGQMWKSCSSAKSLICVSVVRSCLCATRRCARCWDLAAVAVGGVMSSLQQRHFNIILSMCGSFPPIGWDPGCRSERILPAFFHIHAICACDSVRRSETCAYKWVCGPLEYPWVRPIFVGSLVGLPKMFCLQLALVAGRSLERCLVPCR
jgi:hypothetical protein